MSYKRAKTVSYDDDGHDDYDSYEEGGGGDEMSPEDGEQLQQSTSKLKQALGTELRISDDEIRETLWHYYFDVDKSLAYLKSKHSPKQVKTTKSKPASKFDIAINNATKQANGEFDFFPGFHDIHGRDQSMDIARPEVELLVQVEAHFENQINKLAEYSFTNGSSEHKLDSIDPFWDTPWGQIPTSRLSNLIPLCQRTRGGLLGGAPKVSKLAALAAARKKQSEDKRQGDDTQQTPDTNKAASLLDQLSYTKDTAAASKSSNKVAMEPKNNSRATLALRKKPTTEAPVQNLTPEPQTIEQELEMPKQDLRMNPSAFAQALLGSESVKSVGGAALDPNQVSSATQTSNTIFNFPLLSNTSSLQKDPFEGPSPDDIVLKAQRLSSSQTLRDSGTNSLESSMYDSIESLSIKETKVQSKNLNVAEEFQKSNMKKSATFVVVGHVDHGKSTLMGRLLYDLKMVNEQTMRKFRKEAEQMGKGSFALAWVLDSTTDEREHGVTVDIASKNFETANTRFTILDAPGHQDFVPNMIAGANQADFAVLVIDSGINSFESGLRGQTKEHALLVRSMGVQRLIVVVNKMDRVDWSQERFTNIQEQMTAFLTAASFSSSSLSFIPCSGLNGDNVINRSSNPAVAWYKGNTLIEELDSTDNTARAIDRPLRMTIDELYPHSSRGIISLDGRIESGSVQTGDVLLIQPASETAVIKSIVADEAPSDWAVAGQMVTLELVNIDPAHIHRGDIVCAPSSPVNNVRQFTAKILTFEHIFPMFVDVHRGRLVMEAKVAKLVALLDKSTGVVTRKNPRVVQPGTVAKVVIEFLEKDMPIESGWKIVLRGEGRSLATGIVE